MLSAVRSLVKPLYRPFTIPIGTVLNAVFSKGLVRDIHALEVFGKDGDGVTMAYAQYASSLEIWEIDSQWKDALSRNFPDATIKIVDSFAEIKTTCGKFNFVCIDSPLSTYGSYCEHFDLFPSVYRILQDRAIIILNVVPRLNRTARRKYPYLFNDEQLRRRAAFYRSSHPEDISIEDMVEAYRTHSNEHDYDLRWWCAKRRGISVSHFLALYVESQR